MTAEELERILDYDPRTGVFRWKTLPHKCASSIEIGDVAGWVENTGYRRITIGRQRYVAHRLAWLYMKGSWPGRQLDHIDGDKDNNAIINLRLADGTQNKANSKCHSNNFLGVKGVRLHENGKYQARIFLNGRHKSLGCFATIEEAKGAYRRAALEAFGDFARFA